MLQEWSYERAEEVMLFNYFSHKKSKKVGFFVYICTDYKKHHEL